MVLHFIMIELIFFAVVFTFLALILPVLTRNYFESNAITTVLKQYFAVTSGFVN